VRLLEAKPPDNDAHEDVVEVAVTSHNQLTLAEVEDGPLASIHLAPGVYRMRIGAWGRTESRDRSRAFADEGEPMDETPLEHFHVDLWQAPPEPAAIVRQDSGFAHEQLNPTAPIAPPEEARGTAAAWAIVRDVRGEPGARQLDGEPASLALDMQLPGTPTKLFNRLRYAFAWPLCRGGMGMAESVGQTGYHDATLPQFDGAYESAGHIATTLKELKKPMRVVQSWNWIRLEKVDPLRPIPLQDRQRLLAIDSTFTISIEKTPAAEPACTVHLEHLGVPQAWTEDLKHLWAWHLAVLASR
jgi:hypothetical protein